MERWPSPSREYFVRRTASCARERRSYTYSSERRAEHDEVRRDQGRPHLELLGEGECLQLLNGSPLDDRALRVSVAGRPSGELRPCRPDDRVRQRSGIEARRCQGRHGRLSRGRRVRPLETRRLECACDGSVARDHRRDTTCGHERFAAEPVGAVAAAALCRTRHRTILSGRRISRP